MGYCLYELVCSLFRLSLRRFLSERDQFACCFSNCWCYLGFLFWDHFWRTSVELRESKLKFLLKFLEVLLFHMWIAYVSEQSREFQPGVLYSCNVCEFGSTWVQELVMVGVQWGWALLNKVKVMRHMSLHLFACCFNPNAKCSGHSRAGGGCGGTGQMGIDLFDGPRQCHAAVLCLQAKTASLTRANLPVGLHITHQHQFSSNVKCVCAFYYSSSFLHFCSSNCRLLFPQQTHHKCTAPSINGNF